MIEGIEALIWARAIERLLIALFAGASLVMGWHLFLTRISILALAR